jgi:alpha-N-arabinofuranosidase
VYEGIWVDGQTGIPNQNGVRLDMLAALSHLRTPVLRWPGGSFADDYHWRDGVGPIKERPNTANLWQCEMEPNAFGTDEFLRLCNNIGAAPHICVNLGSGSLREARDWLEYCNFSGDSAPASLRAQNGHPQPWQVMRWSVGHAGYGRGDAYAREYVRYASFMRALSPEIQLFARGATYTDDAAPGRNDWNHDFCQEISRCGGLDHLALRRSFSRGESISFSKEEYYALFSDALALERDIELTDAILRYYFPEQQVGIAVDGWGVRHPEAVAENGLEQPNTLRDALMAAAILHVFQRNAARVTQANLTHAVNALHCLAVTNADKMFLTPTYHVFDMMRFHGNARGIMLECESPTFEALPAGFTRKQTLPLLDAFASCSGKKVHLTVVNKSWEDALETRIEVREEAIVSVSGRQLHAEHPAMVNSLEAPSAAAAKRIRPSLVGNEMVQVFPPHSFTALSITLQ